MLDKPRNKKLNSPRFSGQGRNEARPGTLRWYRQYMPQKLAEVAMTVAETGGFDPEASEVIAGRILHWQESKQAAINDEIMERAAKMFEKKKLQKYNSSQMVN